MNPGAPPPPPGYGWSQQPPGYGYQQPLQMKTNTPKTLGVLSMVFGGLVAALSFFSLLAGKQVGMMSAQPGQREAFEVYTREIHGYSLAQSAIMLLMSVALFYIGTGQRSYKQWAVGASIKWSLAAFAVLVFQVVGAVVWVLPAMDHLLQNLPRSHTNAMPLGTMMKMGLVFGVGAYLPYPIILLTWFRKPANAAAMDQASLPVAEVR